MKINLMWDDFKNYESIISDTVFDDLNFKKFIKSLYNDDYKEILEVLKYIPEENIIKKRQDILSDFLIDKNNVLGDVRRLIHNLKEIYSIYDVCDNDFKKKAYFLILIKDYISFIEQSNCLFSEINFNSNELKRFKSFINDESSSPLFHQMKKDFIDTYFNYRKFLNLEVSFKMKDNYLILKELKDDQRIDEVLTEIAKDLNIELSSQYNILVKKDINNSYLKAIEEVYGNECSYLNDFYNEYSSKFDFELFNLDEEMHFFIKIKDLFLHLNKFNLPYCKGNISRQGITNIKDIYDFTLLDTSNEIIPNDVMWEENSKIQIITGVNSGGKTSYLRSIGVNFILFHTTGYLICKEAVVHPIKTIHTHFPNDEDYKVGFGRFKNELDRIEMISKDFSNDCLVLLNETYSSTDEDKAFEYTRKLLEELVKKNVSCIYVTHQFKLIDFISTKEIKILSPLIDPNNDNKRLYKIKEVDDNVSSFTYDILYKYGLTKNQLQRRLEEEKSV